MFVGYYLPSDHNALVADLLRALVEPFPPDRFGNHIYVQVDSAWPGVRLRGLTHFPVDLIKVLLAAADQIVGYAAVVGAETSSLP